MKNLCVVGLQWGDEGKGKIVDVLSESVDAVVRFQGGANAGHTIYVDGVKHVLHHLPAGILHERCVAVLGNGMVVGPGSLLDELDELPDNAVQRLRISSRAHLALPHHISLDRAREEPSGPGGRIGTTLRGIGPAYEGKYSRRGVRAGDLLSPHFIDDRLPELLGSAGANDEDCERGVEVCRRFVERVGPQIVDTSLLLHELHESGKRILFEGAQGGLLDIDFGTYPFVTSSNASFLGLGAGSGFSPRKVDHVLGITKAYCTRVGEGPFPSELYGEEAVPLREAGGEFGATTGRPRRCGWLDLVALAHSVRISDVDSLAVTKADVLDGRETVPVAVRYSIDGEEVDTFPANLDALARTEVVYEEWPGWSDRDDPRLREFLDRIRDRIGIPVSVLSTGAEREQTHFFEPLRSFVEAQR